MERKVAKGGWLGGTVPWGYRVDRETGFLEVNPDEAPLVPIIFDLYLHRRMGARGIVSWLNQRGHRTRGGKPWSFNLVFTVLRNRVYLGEVAFRDKWFPAPHKALIDPEVFAGVQRLLNARGENHSKRRSNPSDFLLSSLIVCEGCGGRFIGTRANGKMYLYRYYSCCTRQRYGTQTCGIDRVDAGRLDAAVLESLLRTYEDQQLLDEAVQQYIAQARADRPNRLEQLAAVEAEIRKADEALDRYFNAFETGSMSEEMCRPRIERLAERLRGLRARQAELTAAIEDERVTAPDLDEVERLKDKIREALLDGPVERRKAILQELVAEVRVESRSCIRPTFRLPLGGVFPVSRMVRLEGIEPPALRSGAGPVARPLVADGRSRLPPEFGMQVLLGR
jgi:site-specific DNA recombinase